MKTKILISVLFLLLITLLISQKSQGKCNTDDWIALKTFYENTDGDNWEHKEGWVEVTGNVPTADCNLENLYGVSLNNDGRVDSLNLSSNKLSGIIPSELGDLINLRYLNLEENQLDSIIPPELGNLVWLEELDLKKNQFSGTIPAELGNLSNLIRLNLYNNKFNDSLPIELGNIRKLTDLDLSYNRLNGNIPIQLGKLINLKSLSFSGNQFSGSIPLELGNLIKLESLSLFSNQLSGSIPAELGNLIRLKSLSLSSNQLSGSIPAELGNLIRLESLSLSSNQLSENLPLELGNLINLTNLNLQSNQLSGSFPAKLGSLTNLIYLDLSSNQLSGGIPPEIGNLTNLESLYLNDNQFSGSISAEFGDLFNLEWLYLNDNQLNGNIPAEFGNLKNLYWLELYNNNFNGGIPAEFGNLNNLECLQMKNNQLSGTIPIELCNLTQLRYLDLKNNQLSGKIPPEIGNLINLWDLNLSSNKLSNIIPPEIGNLINLKNLYLSENHLIGSFPVELGNLTNLEQLQLNNNQLSDSIPKELGNLTNLKNLYLHNNQLNGSLPLQLNHLTKLKVLSLYSNQLNGNIPAGLGNLSNLDSLSLQSNQFIGNIPSELGDLTSLDLLDLSYNQLEGCYEVNLLYLSTGSNSTISDGNNFNDTWEDFRLNGSGACSEPPVYPNCRQNDSIALISIYNTNNMDSIWDIEQPMNTWLGVSINGFECVSVLDLNSLGLNGSIPAAIGNLSNLNKLDLSYNQLTGNIPAELGNLIRLKSLYLNDNDLSGSIPLELGNLANLNTLSLAWNSLIDNIPAELGNLTNMKWLSLSSNQLNGSIPPELGNLINLEVLSISYNQLIGSIPPELGNLTNLTDLLLQDNKLNGSIPSELSNLTNLTDIWLQGNKLTGSIPSKLGNLTKLRVLALFSNQLSGSIPPQLGNLTNLLVFGLSLNELSGNIPSELGNLTNTRAILLNDNQLSGNIPAELGNLTNLEYLLLSYNKLNGNIPPKLGNLINLSALELQNNQLSGGIPAELGNLISTGWIFLSNNQLTGIIPNALGNLNSLSLRNNYFLCEEFSATLFQKIDIDYLPQFFKPINYNDIQSNVFDSLSVEDLIIDVGFPFDTIGFTFQWFKNGDLLPGATEAMLYFDSIKLNNVGRYTLRLQSESCLPDGNTFETISEPIYIILKGYDLLGQPVEYTQLMVEYENKASKNFYEKDIFFDNGGIWADKCDCNRELHLYDFPNDSSSIEKAYIALDKKIKKLKARNKIDGGFNYKLNNIGLNSITVQEPVYINQLQTHSEDNYAYSVNYNFHAMDYSNPVMIYLLDSGFDESNFNMASDFLLSNAPVDSCYTKSAPGYSFIKIISDLREESITIDTDYQDREGHGTFGFRTISKGLEEAKNSKIVPLKIIERATGGNLFDLICALYHAIDHNADVINISAGYRGEPSGILADAIYKAKQKGIFIVAAAGNDGIDIDQVVVPQYPAFYANKYHSFYKNNSSGEPLLDSVILNNVISVAAVNVNEQLSVHSNYGAQSATIAAPGENVYGHGLKGVDAVGTGTSIAAFLTTQVLSREIANNNSRTIEEIWADFEKRYLVENKNLNGYTSTGKQINFSWEKVEIKGCTDCMACNYFQYATIDDGSCYYCVENEVEFALACSSDSNCPLCYDAPRSNFNKLELSIYPNPTAGAFSIEISDHNVENTLSIFDLSGKTLYTTNFSGKFKQVELNDLDKGLYIIEVENYRQQNTQKLLVE